MLKPKRAQAGRDPSVVDKLAALATIATELEELAKIFRADALKDLAAIRQAWNVVMDAGGGDVAEALEIMVGIAHRLAGRGGTFGFPAISEAAKEVEEAVVPLAQAGNALAPADRTRIARLMDGLGVAIEAMAQA